MNTQLSNSKLISSSILNYYDTKLKKFLNSTYALKSDVGSGGGGILYAECSTARNIVDKAVACEGFALVKGACIAIRFTDTSTADPTIGNITLNINNTGAKTIVPKENNTAVAYSWAWAFCKNQTQLFMYNGTNFIWLNQDNTTYTPMDLGFGYGTCTTEEDVTAKVVTLTSYVLIKGGMVSVKFANAVPASATLNINGKGAKYIYYHGAKILAGIINAGDIVTFVYDGTEYQLIAIDNEAKIKANASDIW